MGKDEENSLCWTCGRAYALSDKDGGCAFHRRRKNGQIEGFPYWLCDVINMGDYKIIKVLGCQQYVQGEERIDTDVD